MSVQDHGLEAIRKAAEEVTSGDKSEYKLKIGIVSNDSSRTETILAPTFATIGTSSAQIVASNTSRKGLVLTNEGDGHVYLHMTGGTAVVGSGFVLFPSDTWVMDENFFTTGQINGIATTAGNNISIQEAN